MEIQYEGDLKVSIERQIGDFHITIGDRIYTVQVNRSSEGELTFTVDGQRQHVNIAEDGAHRFIAFDANVYTLTKADTTNTTRRKRLSATGDHSLTATMPGQVVNLLVAEGDAVIRGQPLVVLEAMKMEIRITAPQDGRIGKVHCQKGQIVERGQTLIELIE